MEDILRKIEENTAPKDSFELTISNSTMDFITRFNPPLQLKKGKQYEMALLNLELTIRFQTSTQPTTVLNIPRTMVKTGSPSKFLKVDIDAAIKQQMRTNNHCNDENDKYFISVSANSSTLKTVLTLWNGYQVDFGLPNSMRHILDFNSAVYTTIKNLKMWLTL